MYVNGGPEMATDERQQPTRAQLFRATVTSSGRDVILGGQEGEVYGTWTRERESRFSSILPETTDGFMIYPRTRMGLHTKVSCSYNDEELWPIELRRNNERSDRMFKELVEVMKNIERCLE